MRLVLPLCVVVSIAGSAHAGVMKLRHDVRGAATSARTAVNTDPVVPLQFTVIVGQGATRIGGMVPTTDGARAQDERTFGVRPQPRPRRLWGATHLGEQVSAVITRADAMTKQHGLPVAFTVRVDRRGITASAPELVPPDAEALGRRMARTIEGMIHDVDLGFALGRIAHGETRFPQLLQGGRYGFAMDLKTELLAPTVRPVASVLVRAPRAQGGHEVEEVRRQQARDPSFMTALAARFLRANLGLEQKGFKRAGGAWTAEMATRFPSPAP